MSSGARDFLDTNVLVYAFSEDRRADAAQALLNRGCCVGVQSLNEFANVGRRKLRMTWPDLREALDAITVLCAEVIPNDLATHVDALRLAERYGYSIFDSVLISTALAAGCTTFWSEDVGDGVLIDGRLRILDPFKAN